MLAAEAIAALHPQHRRRALDRVGRCRERSRPTSSVVAQPTYDHLNTAQPGDEKAHGHAAQADREERVGLQVYNEERAASRCCPAMWPSSSPWTR